ncbi:hypothetical protein Peur_009997 [Populus x canadensis]
MLSLLNFNENNAEEFSFKGGSNASAPFEELASEKLTEEMVISWSSATIISDYAYGLFTNSLMLLCLGRLFGAFTKSYSMKLITLNGKLGPELKISSWSLLIASSWRWDGRNVQDSGVTDILLFFSRWLLWAITWPFKLLHSFSLQAVYKHYHKDLSKFSSIGFAGTTIGVKLYNDIRFDKSASLSFVPEPS